jgi:hypothetical protein
MSYDTDTPGLARDAQGFPLDCPCDRKAASALRSTWAIHLPASRRD